MELSLFGPTAYQYYRIPPQYLGLYPSVLPDMKDPNCRILQGSPLIEDFFTTPLHRTVNNKSQRGSRKLFVSHLITHEAPSGAFWQTDHGFEVTSPEFTLLNLATMTKPFELLMATYELCGAFAVFKPCDRAQMQFEEALRLKLIDKDQGWKRAISTSGSPTDLWKRDPLIDSTDMKTFMVKSAGMRGVKRLRWAISRMSGVTASPFEAQASMLLSLPRNEGGWSIDIKNNVRIPLLGDAIKLHDATCVYADILIETSTDSLGLVIECQGRSIHDSEKSALSDAERATALTSMGDDVVQITYKQIKDRSSTDGIVKLVCRKAGLTFAQKSDDEIESELSLRNEILIDWNGILL